MGATERAPQTHEPVAGAGGGLHSAEEIEAIRSRVWVAHEGVVELHEIPHQTAFSMNLMFDRLEELIEPWPGFIEVVDLSEAGRPGADVRAVLRRRVARIRSRLIWVAIIVGSNVIMRAMARLLAYSIGLHPVSLHTTRDEALAKVRDVLANRESSH
jgi:hypothetical protein